MEDLNYLSYNISAISVKNKWRSVKAICRIDVKRIENNNEKITKHYYILSDVFEMVTFIKITREH